MNFTPPRYFPIWNILFLYSPTLSSLDLNYFRINIKCQIPARESILFTHPEKSFYTNSAILTILYYTSQTQPTKSKTTMPKNQTEIILSQEIPPQFVTPCPTHSSPPQSTPTKLPFQQQLLLLPNHRLPYIFKDISTIRRRRTCNRLPSTLLLISNKILSFPFRVATTLLPRSPPPCALTRAWKDRKSFRVRTHNPGAVNAKGGRLLEWLGPATLVQTLSAEIVFIICFTLLVSVPLIHPSSHPPTTSPRSFVPT